MNAEYILQLLTNYLARQSKSEATREVQHVIDTIRIDATAIDRPEFRPIIDSARLMADCGWQRTISSTTILTTMPTTSVFCDGSCRNNGRRDARAGYGVYVVRGNTPCHSYSARVAAEDPQTNQRAELLALQYALNYIAEGGICGATIYTDSKYAIQCVSVWCKTWKAAGWKKSDKKVILHVDIIPSMCELWESISEFTRLEHVFGHTGKSDAISRGNAEADRLALEAASN